MLLFFFVGSVTLGRGLHRTALSKRLVAVWLVSFVSGMQEMEEVEVERNSTKQRQVILQLEHQFQQQLKLRVT